MSAGGRSLPTPTPDSDVFWEGCRAGQLLIPRCRACGELNWFPRAMCRSCSSTELAWERLSGEGVVYSFSIVHRRLSADEPGPYVLALVDLAEGTRIMTHVVDCPPEAVRIGMRVTVAFRPLTEEISLPVFEPAEPPMVSVQEPGG